jgi:hypothetical protein
VKTKKINNTSEIISYNEIKTELRDTDYIVFPKLPISDVIDSSIKQYLTKQEKNYFEKSHFDFVVADKNHVPAFVIEFDGPCHLEREETKSRDIRKNRICQIAELPLLRITDFELEKIDSVSIALLLITNQCTVFYRFIIRIFQVQVFPIFVKQLQNMFVIKEF